MTDQTFITYASGVRGYLQAEWPATWELVSSSRQARRELVRVTLDHFMRGSSIPVAAGEVAFAVFPLLP